MKTIEKKVSTVEDRISKLRKLADRVNSFEEYVISRDNVDIAERYIQVAIEACLDIGKIIIADKALAEPAGIEMTTRAFFPSFPKLALSRRKA